MERTKKGRKESGCFSRKKLKGDGATHDDWALHPTLSLSLLQLSKFSWNSAAKSALNSSVTRRELLSFLFFLFLLVWWRPTRAFSVFHYYYYYHDYLHPERRGWQKKAKRACQHKKRALVRKTATEVQKGEKSYSLTHQCSTEQLA